MKKILLAIIAIIALLGLYYITIGSKQMTIEMKKEINNGVIQLKNSGFNVTEREIQENREHFVIDFNNTKKILKYIKAYSKNDITEEDIALLKGLKIAFDIEYNPTPKDAIGVDIYPVKLPKLFHQEIINNEDKKIVATIEDMIKNREVLIHININKLASGFDGYIKDINQDVKLLGLKFNGDIEHNKVKNMTQTIKELSYDKSKELTFKLLNLKNFMSNPMNMNFNNQTRHSIERVLIKSEMNHTISIEFNDISGSSQDTQKDKLINSGIKLNIASIKYMVDNSKIVLKNISGDIDIKNINIEAFKELDAILSKNLGDSENFEKAMPILEKILSSDISIEIPNISIEEIIVDKDKVTGFKLNALIKTDKNIDFKKIKNNPLALNSIIDVKINIEASNELVTLLSSNPRAMVLMMILQPVDKNGKKYYDIRFNKGSLKINGRPLM
jgi:hypothetical protein